MLKTKVAINYKIEVFGLVNKTAACCLLRRNCFPTFGWEEKHADE